MKEMKDCLEKHRVSLAGPCVIHRFLSCISGEKKKPARKFHCPSTRKSRVS